MTRKLKWTQHSDLAIDRRPSMKRDEFLDWMTFKGGDRIPFTEIFGPIIGLKEEWEDQGATPAELDFSAFDFRAPLLGGVPVNAGGPHGTRPTEVLEETDTYIRTRDGLGRTMRLNKGAATIPLPEDYPVKTMDDWLELKPLYEYSDARFREGWQEHAREQMDLGAAVRVGIPGGFDAPRQLLGEERVCLAFFEQPELIHDILQTIGDTAECVLDRVSAAVQVDILAVHEDMAGKSGPLAGPRQIREFITPYYRRIWDLLSSRGARLFDQDSDGDMNSVIPAFIEAGVNCMHPMEPAANMDIVETRRQYGTDLAFYGGLDKHVLRRSKAEIEAELEYKIPPMLATRGCMLGLDHRIPNGTPLENYRFYIDKVWELIGR